MAYTTIDDPSAHFQTVTYSGNGSTQSITNDGNSDLQPDWIWFKNITNSPRDHVLIDSTRGVDLSLYSNQTKGDQSLTDVMSSFNSDGFSLESNVRANESSQTHVAWQWKANGGTTTSTNASGSTGDNTDIIASVRQTNTTAGFSIITYTGDSTAGKKVTHGLGATPEFIIVRNRDNNSEPWGVFTTLTGVKALALNSNAAQATDSGYWSDTLPDSTHFTVGSHGSTGAAAAFVAYAFTGIQGYSKFGSYKGNGSSTVTEGPFIYTGFKPAWTMIKRADSANDGWYIHDSTRSPSNVIDKAFRANANNAESSENIDFLSNGFAIRIGANNNFNNASGTYIYMAFAEHPFVSSKGVPVTAR